MKNKLVYITVLGIVLFNTMSTFAQGPGDEGDGGLEGGDPAPAPIDTKLYVLTFIALLYGYYLLKGNREKA
jgi:hypothetical protein